MSTPSAVLNPCLRCGACCAYFRVSFYWAECDEATENGVPATLTRPLSPFRLVMLGTSGPAPRCVALLGTVGEEVRCTVYDRRPSVCRELVASWLNGQPNPQCDRARAAWNLEPLTPGHSGARPGRMPRAA